MKSFLSRTRNGACMVNEYSKEWKEHFLDNYKPEFTKNDIDLLCAIFPLDTHPTLLDLGCGIGRHAIPLSKLGYKINAIDKDPTMLDSLISSPDYSATKIQVHCIDFRDMSMLQHHHGIYSMWQSFGYYDEKTNLSILRATAGLLLPKGKLLLDVFNKAFYEINYGTRQIEKSQGIILEESRFVNNRYSVKLTYPNGNIDRYSFFLYTPKDLEDIMSQFNLVKTNTYVWNVPKIVDARDSRFQILFENT